jgi:anti-sigma regulatory factor (Ser/Thr protein kinase)
LKELSLHILDLAENSIKARATIIRITIIEDFSKDILSIVIEDNGSGMDEEFLKVVADPFITTRTTRNVGLGVSLMKAASERCDGSFSIDSTKGKGTKVTSTFKHSHIDRAPIGNVGQTIVALINHNDAIEYVYTHNIDDQRFIFDTREIKKLIEGVSIRKNEILLWISEYINDNINNLYEHINHL